MKISERDLESSVLSKVNRLDEIVSSYEVNPSLYSENHVSYDGKNFVLRKDQRVSQKIFDYTDIMELSYFTRNRDKFGIYRNAFDNNFFLNREGIYDATRALLADLNEASLITEKPIITKKYNDEVYFLGDAGNLYLITEKKVQLLENIANRIKLDFAIAGFGVYDILDFELGNGEMFFSTKTSGIIAYNLERKTAEVRIGENSVLKMLYIGNNQLLCATDWIIYIYNTEKGLKTEKYSNLSYNFQLPNRVSSIDNEVFILGRPYGMSNSDRLLHFWKLDAAKISLNNYDGVIYPNECSTTYVPQFMDISGKNLFLSGTYGKKIIVWKYDRDALEKPYEKIEIEFKGAQDITCIKADEKYLFVAINDRLLMVDYSGEILWNFKLISSLKSLEVTKEGIILFERDGVFKTSFPNFKSDKEILLNIFDEQASSNNIDILVDGVSDRDMITIIDGETGVELKPFVHFVYNRQAIIKMINCKVHKINMKISLKDASSKIKGISVKNNRIFMK